MEQRKPEGVRSGSKEVNLVFNVLRNDAKNWPIERIQSSHCGANPRRILQLDWQRLLTAVTSPPGGDACEGEQYRSEASKNRHMINASTTLTPRTWVCADENQEQAAAGAAGMHRDGSAIAAVIALEPAHYLDTLDTNHCPSLAGTLSLWVTFGSCLPRSNDLFLSSQSLSRRSKPQVQYPMQPGRLSEEQARIVRDLTIAAAGGHLGLGTEEAPRTTQMSKTLTWRVASSGQAASSSWPEIAFTVTRLQEAQCGPGKVHFELLRHLWRCVIETKDPALMVGDKDFTAKDMGFRAYGDAEFSNYLRRLVFPSTP
uniref:Uncharacterized protein n=1 Tax=Pyricularia oryzae (strain P131) TaxID=1143193 RepID=L7IW08_PYRO1